MAVELNIKLYKSSKTLFCAEISFGEELIRGLGYNPHDALRDLINEIENSHKMQYYSKQLSYNKEN